MTTTAPVSEMQTFTITEEINVRASLEQTFTSLLVQMGRQNQKPDGTPLPMVIEPRPGGRWYRDLGGENGHLWGFVQSVKRPTLLEIFGPLFLSTGATSNLMYRLSETPDGTLIKFT
ncbi:MAG: SRPBCC domain-containing protein, partial [Acidobacteriota bacterium]